MEVGEAGHEGSLQLKVQSEKLTKYGIGRINSPEKQRLYD